MADRIKESAIVVGTGDVTLAGKTGPYQAFAAKHAVGTTGIVVCIESATQWEIVKGTLVSPTTFARVEVLDSSNAGALVSFDSGEKVIFETVADFEIKKMLRSDDADVATIPNDATVKIPAIVNGARRKISVPDLLNSIGTPSSGIPSGATIAGTDKVVLLQGNAEAVFSVSALAAAIAAINAGNVPTDDTAPSIVSGVVEDLYRNSIVLTFSETLGASTPDAAAFVVSGGKSVTGVSRSGATITLTTNSAYAYGDSITVTYNKPASNPIQDEVGNQTLTFTGFVATNNISAPAPATDTAKPTMTSAQVANATPSSLVMTFSEPLAAVTPDVTAFAVSGGKTVNSVVVSGSTVTLTVNSAYVYGDVITVSYTQPATNPIQDVAGNKADSITNAAVTNNVASAATTTYTITGYSGNAVKDTYDASTNTATIYDGHRSTLTGPFTNGNGYFNITPAPASVMSGWGDSPTVPPAEIVATDNSDGSIHKNGLTAMTKPAAWSNQSRLWYAVGTTNAKKYFWIKPVDGVAQCMNPNGMTITGA